MTQHLLPQEKNFWGQYWCDAINAVNVGEEIEAERSNASVNMEQVYSWDPDIIFISNFTKAMPEDLYNNTIGDNDWSSVSAVKMSRFTRCRLAPTEASHREQILR